MLPFRIEDVNSEHVIGMSEVISDAVDANYPKSDAITNINNAVALAVVAVGFVQAVAYAFDVDETDLFDGIADAINDGALPSFR